VKLRRELLPPARAFFTKELGRFTRPSRGWCRGNCPFHQSKSRQSFSINLDSGAFHCFGCGVSGGDIIAFVMQRDKLSFQQAAQALGCWDAAGVTSPDEIRKAKQEREQREAERRAEEERERRRRIEACDWLHALERIYRGTKNRLTELRRGAPEEHPGEQEQCWWLLSTTLPQIRTAREEYAQWAGLGGE
jgi:CHC2 zinc finger